MKKFTLLELLIVIAIIGILLTLLLPSLQKAKEKGRTVVCASNQAQVYRHAMVWASKNNNWLPYGNSWHVFSGSNNLKQGTTNKWMAMGKLVRDGEITSPDILNCPSSKNFIYGKGGNSFKANNKPNLVGFNFSTNLQWFNTNNGYLRPGQKKFFASKLEQEALSMDAFWSTEDYKNTHETFSNITYSDGHVNVVRHKNMPLRGTITSFNNGFNNTVKDMWRDLEIYF